MSEDKKPPEQVGGTHYSRWRIQPISFIEAAQLGYHAGNVVKYLARYKYKNGLEDLKKAKWYLDRLIEIEEQSLGPKG